MIVRLKPKNLQEVTKRAAKLARSMITGTGSRNFSAECKTKVQDEYHSAFVIGGFEGGDSWATNRGHVDLVLTARFANSFAKLKPILTRSGGVLNIRFANAYTHDGTSSGQKNPTPMTKPYVAALRDGLHPGGGKTLIKIDISGPAGGISKNGAKQLFKSFKGIVYDEATRLGYTRK